MGSNEAYGDPVAAKVSAPPSQWLDPARRRMARDLALLVPLVVPAVMASVVLLLR